MTKQLIDQSFKAWTRDDIESILGIVLDKELTILQEWLQTDIAISQQEQEELDKLLLEAEVFIDYWNETELRENFIIPLTRLVGFKNIDLGINTFSERQLQTQFFTPPIYKVKLHGFVDWMVAMGKKKPKHPFFFIHEYKPEEGVQNDGKGQLLAEMCAAQQLNQQPPLPTIFQPHPTHFYKDMPIYGCYVVGRYWYFLVLDQKRYGVTKSGYSVTVMEQLQQVFKLLKAQKQRIEQLMKTNRRMIDNYEL